MRSWLGCLDALRAGPLRDARAATSHRHTVAEGSRHRAVREGDRIRRQSDRNALAPPDDDDRGVPDTTSRTAAMSGRWTTPDDIAARVRRRWDDGSLLHAYASGDPFDPIEVPLRGPKPSQVGDDIAAARSGVAALDAGRRDDRRYTLQWQSIGGRQIGRNRLPIRAAVSSFEQAWALLGVATSVRHFDDLLALAQRHRRV